MRLSDSIEIRVSQPAGRGKRVMAKESIPAKLYGPLAVHRDIMQGKRQLWKVTHVASGCGVLGELTLKAAVAVAKDLRDLPGWADPSLGTGRTAENIEVYAALYEAVREARRKHVGGH